VTCPAARSFRPCPARPAPGNGQPVTSAAGRDRLMTDKHTVTVAGVPVTVTVTDRVLAITVGRFDPGHRRRAAAHPSSLWHLRRGRVHR